MRLRLRPRVRQDYFARALFLVAFVRERGVGLDSMEGSYYVCTAGWEYKPLFLNRIKLPAGADGGMMKLF